MVTCRLATESDYEHINNFYNRIYAANRTIEQFYWEFHNAPDGHSIYVVAVDGERIVGTNCVIPIRLVGADGRVILSGKSEDTLVDPDYRGQGIFGNICDVLFAQCKEQGIQVIWGFTSAKKPLERVGFTIPYSHQQSLAVNKVLASYRYLSSLNTRNKAKEKLKIFGLCVLSKFKMLGKSGKPSLLAYEIVEDSEISEGVDALIGSNLNKLKSSFSIFQKPAFQRWRLYDNPNFHKVHTFGFFDREKVLRGLIVLNSHPDNVAYVCQASFHADLPEADAISMIRHATHRIFKSGMIVVRNWQFDHNPLNAAEIVRYKQAGHTHLNRGIGLVWKILDDTQLDPKMFYLSRIATQGVL